MDITGVIYVYVNESKSGKNLFSTKVGKEGKLYANVRFSKDIPSDKLSAGFSYKVDVKKGFLTNDVYNDKDYLTLVVTEAKVLDKKANAIKSSKNEELPF